MNGHYRIDASPSYKGNPQPTRSTPVNTVAQSPLYGRGGDQHGLDRSGRFVAYQPGPPPPPPSVTNTPMSAFRNAEERGGPRPHRMSLLHPPPQPQAEYNIPPASAPMTPRADRPSQQGPPYGGESSGMGKMVPSLSESPPCKKLRLGDSKPDVHMPLRIDTDRTRSGPAYNPQVEAISPTLPSEPLRDESPLRSTKEDLMQQLARLDREIAKTESQIAKLKKKKVELEEAATQPQRDLEEPAPAPDTMNRSLPHIIYAENRKKALEAHQVLSKLGPKVDLPLYNQPSDTAVYHENKSKHASLKAKLHDYFKNKMREKEKRETYLTTTYAKLSADWARRLEKIENNSKKKAKDAKTREIFEKVFPELRKQREDKERFSRVGSRIKSDADLEEIMDGLHEQELEDKKMRSYAVIPPILLDEKSRKRRFNNRNGLIEDPMQEYKDKQLLNLWTEQEKEIFKEKYLQHPKNFSMIKSYLERKSVADCVQYYYLSKKAQNYRQLLRKNRARTRSTRNQQSSTSGQTGQVGSVAGGMATIKTETNGVTTRGQKEQVKNEQGVISNNGGGGSSSGAPASSSATPTSSANAMTNSSTLNPNSNNGNNNSSNNSTTNNNNNNGNNNMEGGNGNNGSPATSISNSGGGGGIGGASGGGNSNSASNQNNFSNTGGSQSSSASAVPSASVPTSQENSVLSISASGQSSDYIGKSKSKRKEENKDALMNEMDSTDDENEPYTGEKGVPHSCVVCKSGVESYIHSRPLLRTQVAQYGLSESDVQPGDRVCNTCRCKSVRHRYKPSKQCPIPTCPAKKARVKRLRPFPAIWKDLSDEKRDAIMAKYQIPPTATKCCTACFNRINRRLSPNTSLDTPDDPGSDTTRWTDDEIETMKKTLVEFGTDWRKLSEKINSKSDLQCRNFYFNFRKKYGLDALVQEYKKSKGGDGPPTLTDEEESGSTTSSCDETVAPSHDQSPRSSSNKNKDDYDSSATVSAEEGGGAEPEKPPNPVPEMRSMPMNSPTPLSLTVRHQQPATERNQGPPPSRIQSVAQHIHNQENGQQVSGTISLGSSHHTIVPPPQPPHATMSSLHPNHPLHSPQITASLALQQRSSPNIQVHPSQQQHPTYPTPVISHGASQINHHNQGQPQGISHHLSLHQARGLRYPSPEGPDGQEPPISVRVDDLMSATIERHLRRNPTNSSSVNSGSGQMHPGQSVSPTLQSILKSQPPPNTHHMISQIPQPGHLQHSGSNQGQQLPQHQGQQGPPQHQQQQQGLPPQQQGPPPPQHVTAQVPTSSPHYPPHHGMNYGPKVDVRTMSQMQHHMVPREVSIVQLPQRDDCVTLDLSMKKRPASPNLPHQRPPSNGPPPAHQPLDYASRGPPQGSQQDMYYAQKFSNAQRHTLQQPQLQRQQPQLVPPPPKQAKVPPPPALITKPPSLSPMKDGSITHGTPIHHTQQMSAKFEGLARPASKEGSITQGTPKGPMYGMYERPPPAEYFKRMSPAGSPYYHGNPNAYYGQRPPSAGQRSPPHPPPQTSPFSADQHNSSRQIIINDYYTSQQMQPTQHPPQPSPSPLGQPRNVEQPKRNVNPAGPGPMYMLPPRQEIPYRQSPPPSSIPPPTQHRQGVIQRANPNRTVVKEEHGRYPQHDAFTSLVDVASSAPSLPVPKEENRRVCLPRVEMVRDGKSIVDMERSRVGPPMNQPNHPPPHQQSPHIYRPPPGTVPNQPSSDPIRVRSKEVYGREAQDSTLTAASLIDAIITHQINQPSPNDRSSPAPTNRTGDRLFASFQRSPAPHGHGNPGNPQQGPHNLSIPNQVHGHGPPQHEEKVVVNDGRMNHKMQPGSMSSSSGGMVGNPSHSSQHHGPPTSSPQMMNQNTHLSKKNNNEDEVMHYKSWKLRKALQLENEKQQQQQQQQIHVQQQQQQHPDERRIIRVHTEEPNMTNRPPSMPSRMSPEGHYQRSERGDPPPSMKSGPSMGPGSVPSFGRREGISLDYFNNLIMEKMRNENNEEMKSEDVHERKHDPASSMPTMNLPGGSASHIHGHSPAASGVHAHSHFGGLAGRIAAAARDDMRSSSNSDSQRGGDTQHFQLKMEKMDDEPSKGGDSDSPASMVIDESADIKEGKPQQTHNESGSSTTATSQPNYEPLTDEEN